MSSLGEVRHEAATVIPTELPGWLPVRMTESPKPSADRDKWAHRRAVRRAEPARPAESLSAAVVPARPASLNRAFVLWMMVGIPTVVALIGIVIIAAALNLRAGYRGARVMLTVLGAPSFIAPVSIVAGMVFSGGFSVYAVLPLIFSAVVIAAVILMWRPEVTSYFRAMRNPA